LWALLIFIPTSIFLEQYFHQKTRKKILVLLLVTTLVFVGRNAKRIFSEMKQYNYKPIIQTFYYVNKDGKENYFSSNRQIEKLIVKFEKCKTIDNMHSEPCISINKKAGAYYGKYFFNKKEF
jgi:hypothetical protein